MISDETSIRSETKPSQMAGGDFAELGRIANGLAGHSDSLPGLPTREIKESPARISVEEAAAGPGNLLN